jgi:hypothetical protein
MNIAHIIGMDDVGLWEDAPQERDGQSLWFLRKEGFEYRVTEFGGAAWVERRAVRPLQILMPRPRPGHLRHVIRPARPDRRAQIGLCRLDRLGPAAKGGRGDGGPGIGRQPDRAGCGQDAPHQLAAAIDRPVVWHHPPIDHRSPPNPHGGIVARATERSQQETLDDNAR